MARKSCGLCGLCQPFSAFVDFIRYIDDGDFFPRWKGKSAVGKQSSPIELMVLGSLRYLGRGWTFDDMEEATAVSEETHRCFFHQFIKFGSTALFEKYVITPNTSEEITTHMTEFTMAGLPGACSSSDATSIVHEMCSHRLQRHHKGFKSKHPTRTYNLTVNHRRQILGTTSGHPGSFNDKTVVLYDNFITDIKSGKKFDDHIFELLEKHGGKIVPVKYRGVWVVVDNGYHNWSITVPPYSNSCRYDEIRWSEWMESMRKDVECTFGILKGRWRILKVGIRLHDISSVDMVWQTCCALHNMLLDIDGLNKPWDGVNMQTSDYSGSFGCLDYDDMPFAVQRLYSPGEIRAYDTSLMLVQPCPIQDDDDDEHFCDGKKKSDNSSDSIRVVRNLSLEYFHARLVEHFDIKFKAGEVHWPRSRGKIHSSQILSR